MKKKLPRILSLALAFCLLFGIAAFAALNENTPAYKATLKFSGDGKFTILQISDIQHGPLGLPITKDLIRESVKAADADLIVLTGDNISGGSCSTGIKFIDRILVKMAIDFYMSVFEKAGVPVAVVFGNHDAENLISREEQFEIYGTYKCFIGFDEGEDVYGCGNYNVPIFPSGGGTVPAFNLWMFDSGMYDRDENGNSKGYDYIRQNQLDWYINAGSALKAQNGGEPVPSFVFQHIIVPEIYDALITVPEGTPGALKRGEQYYMINPDYLKAGVMSEMPCPSNTNGGQFSAVKSQGDVIAMFFGHDHVNTFEVAYQGIDIVNSPGITFGSYGDEVRGCRVITLNESDLWSYETRVYCYDDFYGNDEAAQLRYKLFDSDFSFNSIVTAVQYFFKAYVFTLFGLLK
ncbi:MAG: metallophosphoesterase [Oscillospiraceae bacterium]|nr:metallophosphoesterase [Oscillospiraceae bacterium]